MDQDERERLAESMLPKIEKLSRNMTKTCPWLRDEAFSSALVCLAIEINKFDPSISDNFGAFVMQQSRNRINDCIRINHKAKNSMFPLSGFPEEIDEYENSGSGLGRVGWEIEYEDFARFVSSKLKGTQKKAFDSIYVYCKGEDLKQIAKSIGVSYAYLCEAHCDAMKFIRGRLGVTSNA